MDSIQRKQKNSNISHTDHDMVSFAIAHSRIVRYHDHVHRAQRFARGGFRTHFFYTEDSGRYISPKQRMHVHRNHGQLFDVHSSFDTINHRYRSHMPRQMWNATQIYRWRMRPVRTALSSWRGWLRFDISPARAWNLSLVGAMLFGMISMTMIYRSFGQAAFATEPSAQPVHEGQFREVSQTITSHAAAARAISARTAQAVIDNARKQKAQTQSAMIVRDVAQIAFEERAREMVAGYPIEKMLPELFKQDRAVAAMMIAMAKQESQWGKRVPVRNGKDCLNYWGFRSKRAKMGTGGHTCFDSIPDAVQTVGRRVKELMYDYNRTTAERMIVWKCGYSCAGHNPHNVASWKRTVQMYYDVLMKEEERV